MTWDAKEALFVLLLERLDRPTLGQYAKERRTFQKKPAVRLPSTGHSHAVARARPVRVP